jgi:hypothetical protein
LLYVLRFSFKIDRIPLRDPPIKSSDESEEDPIELLRNCSKALFGNKNRLEVAVAIAESDGLVNATDLHEELRLAHPRVRSQLVALAEVGLLADAPMKDVKKWYLRQESPFWGTCRHLAHEWRS